MTPKLVLASVSPRRKELLRKLKIPFKVVPSLLAEPPPGSLDPVSYTRKLALAKARLVAQRLKAGLIPGIKEGLILGADTVVVHRGIILGKPTDFADACRTLSRLQGTTHRVVTAVALVDALSGREKLGHALSTVTMRSLLPPEIAQYARRHVDKAGAYAVQEKKDPVVAKVRGSYTNVVGFPLEVVQDLLKRFSARSKRKRR